MVNANELARALQLRQAGGSYSGKCPKCGYPDGFSVAERDGTALFKCHAGGCTQSDIIDALQKMGLWAPKGDASKDHPTTATAHSLAAQKLWERSRPAPGTLVETYLRSRQYGGPIPPVLKFLANAKHTESGLSLPIMVAAVTSHNDQCVNAVHRTFLAPDGTGKANVTPAKKSLGQIGGGAVWLSPPAKVMCVAEGIETALSCLQATGIACAAALSTGGMRKLLLPPMPLASEVIIAADNDTPGIEAAMATAQRLHHEGRRVRIATPPTPGTDFNDMLRLGGIG